MAATAVSRLLDNNRIDRIVRRLSNRQEIQQPLIFLARTPVVNADDEELVGLYDGDIFAADLIADDQEAVTYETGNFEVQKNNIPKAKMGIRVREAMLKRLSRLARGSNMPEDEGFWSNYQMTLADNVVRGIRVRFNSMIAAAAMGAYNYSRMGVRFQIDWGMPAYLKPTTSTAWSSTAATPIADILGVKYLAQETDGETFNRMTLSLKTLNYIFQTTEFMNYYRGLSRFDFPTGAINTFDVPVMTGALNRILDMQVELHDAKIREKQPNGKVTMKYVQPRSKVILSSTSDDNDPDSMDFGSGIVTESIAAQIISGAPNIPVGFGPVSYWTGRADLNPPDVTCWGVARGLPRKKRKTMTACLTVGTFI